MDPNANLMEQRAIQARLATRDHQTPMDYILKVHDHNRLSELAAALDTWITGGGFLPDAWARVAGKESKS